MRRGVAVLLGVAVIVAAPAAARDRKLPPDALRGAAHLLDQYPTPSLATPAQRKAAVDLLAETRAAVRPWRVPRVAKRAGFRVGRTPRRAGNRGKVFYFHAENRRYSNDDVVLDPRRPEVLIYADVRGRPLVLVGVMFALKRGERGPNPGGPITRWHSHIVCARGAARGVQPRADGSCPPGTKRRLGSEMMHVWFTHDLRSAFAIHAPVPELCGAGLLPPGKCGHAGHGG